MELYQKCRFEIAVQLPAFFSLQRRLQNPGSVAAVSDRRLSWLAISAVGDRRYRVLQAPLQPQKTLLRLYWAASDPLAASFAVAIER
jgi:hypothetical protein